MAILSRLNFSYKRVCGSLGFRRRRRASQLILVSIFLVFFVTPFVPFLLPPTLHLFLCLFAVFFLLVAQLAPELFVPETTLEKFEVIPQSGKIGRSAVFGIIWDTGLVGAHLGLRLATRMRFSRIGIHSERPRVRRADWREFRFFFFCFGLFV